MIRKGFAILALFTLTHAQAATLVHTNDILGELEPCGCRSNPLGGMVRESNWIKTLPTPLLKVDAGDLLFQSESIPDLLAPQAELQASYLLKAMDGIHQDIIVPGEKDFALGVKIFDKLRSKSHARFLAANLKRKKGGKFLGDHVVVNLGPKLKVGVFGVVGESLPWPKELAVSPALKAAKTEVARLRALKVDLIVAVTHQGIEKDRELAHGVPGIDVIVGGHSQTFLQQPEQVDKTVILQSSFRNQYVGALPLAKPIALEGYKLVGMDANYDSPAQAPTEMDAIVHQFKEGIAELNSKENQSEDADLVKKLEAQGVDAHAKFQTFPRCAECHIKQFDFWRKTPHAHALTPLVEKNQIRNKECLTCHTVGLGDPAGWHDVTKIAETHAGFLTPEELEKRMRAIDDAKAPPYQEMHEYVHAWAPVQCESCHQPGRNHPFAGQYSKDVPRDTCLMCHTPARAPEWYLPGSGNPDWEKIAAKRALVTCPAGTTDPDQDSAQ